MRIPVVIIGGFLGAGKTTAVNHLLRTSRQRTAVLVNDFGVLNIDAHLIAAQEGGIFALANGCVCCSIGPDFSATLARILALNPAPERIVVESSGVSDPWRIAQLVKLERSARLEAVIVLADALELPIFAADRWLADTIARQIVRADIVALSKCDLANANARRAARATLAAIRPDVPVLEIAGGALPDIVVNSAEGAPPSRFLADLPEHGFRSWHWLPDGTLDPARLREALEALPPSVLRGKGILELGNKTQCFLLQLVGRRWSLTPWQQPSERTTAQQPRQHGELVLIGTEALPQPETLAAHFAPSLNKP